MEKMKTEVIFTLDEIFEGKRWFHRFLHNGYEWKIEQTQDLCNGLRVVVHLCGFNLERPEKIAYAKTLGVNERMKLADVRGKIEWFDRNGKLGKLLSECGNERMGRLLNMLIEKREEEGYVDYIIKLNGDRVCVVIDHFHFKNEWE